jgi:hypothetical protein
MCHSVYLLQGTPPPGNLPENPSSAYPPVTTTYSTHPCSVCSNHTPHFTGYLWMPYWLTWGAPCATLHRSLWVNSLLPQPQGRNHHYPHASLKHTHREAKICPRSHS